MRVHRRARVPSRDATGPKTHVWDFSRCITGRSPVSRPAGDGFPLTIPEPSLSKITAAGPCLAVHGASVYVHRAAWRIEELRATCGHG